jgi:hypothetical protein
VIKSRRIRWTGHVATYGRDKKYAQNFGRRNLQARDILEDLCIDGRILKMDLKEIEWEGVNCIHWLRIGSSGGMF